MIKFDICLNKYTSNDFENNLFEDKHFMYRLFKRVVYFETQLNKFVHLRTRPFLSTSLRRAWF